MSGELSIAVALSNFWPTLLRACLSRRCHVGDACYHSFPARLIAPRVCKADPGLHEAPPVIPGNVSYKALRVQPGSLRRRMHYTDSHKRWREQRRANV